MCNINSLYGDSEALVGKWFKRTGKRSQIFLATKFGFIKGDPSFSVDSSAEYCKKACAESLRLLGTDYIDLCKYSVVLLSCSPCFESESDRLTCCARLSPPSQSQDTH